jgi:twitching motility protein PilT
VLRQDPDIILIGELRDLETISVALTAAETGHLVFATLHTQSAQDTVNRIIDVFPPAQQQQIRSQLAATLRGVVCQTLVKRADGKGRAAAAEIMVVTSAISTMIRRDETHQIHQALQSGAELGMQTLNQHLAELVVKGVIERETAEEVATDSKDLDALIQGKMTKKPIRNSFGGSMGNSLTGGLGGTSSL